MNKYIQLKINYFNDDLNKLISGYISIFIHIEFFIIVFVYILIKKSKHNLNFSLLNQRKNTLKAAYYTSVKLILHSN